MRLMLVMLVLLMMMVVVFDNEMSVFVVRNEERFVHERMLFAL